MKPTILDYVDWRGDLSFKDSPFNEVDNIIFSMLIYLDLQKTMDDAKYTYPTLSDGVDTFFKQYDYKTYKFGLIVPNKIKDLAKKVQKTKRYGQILILDYVKEVSAEERTQFCAGTFLLDDGNIVVAFEGTDDTLAGWYEDFEMFVNPRTIAQDKSVKYLNRVGTQFFNKNIYVCGHSKGGNLAFYSAMFANDDVKSRIKKIYNSDGPGLLYERYDEEKAKIIDEKGITLVPNTTIIGALFDQRGEIKIVDSKAKNLFQHDPFELIALGSKFVKCDKFNKSTLNIQKEMKKLYLSTSTEEASRCIDTIYKALYKENKRTLTDLKITDYNIINKFIKIDKQDKEVIKKFASILINNNAFIK